MMNWEFLLLTILYRSVCLFVQTHEKYFRTCLFRYAKDAASLAAKVEADLDSKLPLAKKTHEKAVVAAANATAANDAALAALNASAEARGQAEGASNDLTALLGRIGNILDGEVTTRSDIDTLVNLTLALSIGQVQKIVQMMAPEPHTGGGGTVALKAKVGQ